MAGGATVGSLGERGVRERGSETDRAEGRPLKETDMTLKYVTTYGLIDRGRNESDSSQRASS